MDQDKISQSMWLRTCPESRFKNSLLNTEPSTKCEPAEPHSRAKGPQSRRQMTLQDTALVQKAPASRSSSQEPLPSGAPEPPTWRYPRGADRRLVGSLLPAPATTQLLSSQRAVALGRAQQSSVSIVLPAYLRKLACLRLQAVLSCGPPCLEFKLYIKSPSQRPSSRLHKVSYWSKCF